MSQPGSAAANLRKNIYILNRQSQVQTPINIINLYGEQESRASMEEVEDKRNWVVQEIDVFERSGE